MNYTDLIQRLRDTSRALDALAEHLGELQNADEQDADITAQKTADRQTADADINEAEIIEADIEADIIEAAAIETDTDISEIDIKDTHNENAAPQQRPNQAMPPLANMLGNMMRGMNNGIPGLPNIPGIGGLNMPNIPKSLEELQANPQMMSMLDNVRSNPQMLNMISSLSGVDSSRIAQALQSIHPQAADQASLPEQAAAQPMPLPPQTAAIINSLPTATPPQSANIRPTASLHYLDSLLNEWRWQPYARVWSS